MASDIIANLRAIIISSKGGLPLANIRADYREAFGEDIPLRALGFNSLESFFKSNSQNFTVIGNKVQAVAKSSSVHIVSLVNRQRNSKKAGRSKLTSKQAYKLRKPVRFEYTTPPRFEHAPVKFEQTPVEKKSSPKLSKQENIKNSPEPAVENIPKANVDLPFENFEDLKITANLQSRLLKIKTATPVDSEDSPNESVNSTLGSLPASPFRRSLAKNTEEEILSAKKSSQFRLDFSHPRSVKSPNNQLSPVLSAPDSTGDSTFEQKLKQFCLDNRLTAPTYSILIREPLNEPKCYGCKLNIGDNFQVSTYPVEFSSEAAARELASKKAYNHMTLNNNLPSAFETENVVTLRELCYKRGLPGPVFKTIECHPKNYVPYFICKVKIGDHILLSSYPEELRDESSAKDLAAKKAYEYLISGSTESKEPAINNSETVINRIYDIIKTKEYGVWSNKMPILYLDTYKEELDSSWFELVKNSPKFEVDHIERVGCILRTKNVEQTTEVPEKIPVLASLKLPESNLWEVYITNVVTSAEVWCRLIGKDYSEAYDSMMTKLELQPPTVSVKNPVVGEIYLINLEESWNRVRVVEISTDKGEASVFLIDIGVNEVVTLSQLFYLEKSFFSIAPQAILLSLNELDSLAECEELQSPLFHTLLGNSFIAEVVAILDSGGNVTSVNLWDTSTNDDINVNLKLIDDVIKTLKGPSLPSLSSVREMYVSYVDDNGDVFLQTSRQNSQYVNWIISVKLKHCGQLTGVTKMDSKKLYVVRSLIKGLYYRTKLSKTLNGNSALMKFIDFGYEERVIIQDLFDLEVTALDLATIPSQVVQAKLANLKVSNAKVLAKLREYILEQSVLVKVTQKSVGTVPEVELFVRSQTDGTLSSVNNKITNDKELLVADPPVRKKSYVVGLENTLSKNLPMPNIPPIGSYFNVIVTLAAHPGLFSVQPLVTQSELMALMFRMQEKCEKTFSKPLFQEEFKIGELYAVKHADDYWYRAYAHAIVNSSAFTVCLCDFGDFIMVPAEKLMPLSTEFKTFPYQAIRAYLAGIAPANKDWSPLDCVKFREMVIEKQFVSRVMEINRDANNPNFITLGLILVDTSTAEDIYIHQILIQKGMAVLKS